MTGKERKYRRPKNYKPIPFEWFGKEIYYSDHFEERAIERLNINLEEFKGFLKKKFNDRDIFYTGDDAFYYVGDVVCLVEKKKDYIVFRTVYGHCKANTWMSNFKEARAFQKGKRAGQFYIENYDMREEL